MSEPVRVFDRVGIPVDEPQPNEDWVYVTKVRVNNPRPHKLRIEYLRDRADSPVPGQLNGCKHVAYHCRTGDYDALVRDGEVQGGAVRRRRQSEGVHPQRRGFLSSTWSTRNVGCA